MSHVYDATGKNQSARHADTLVIAWLARRPKPNPNLLLGTGTGLSDTSARSTRRASIQVSGLAASHPTRDVACNRNPTSQLDGGAASGS